jgi:Flp pilus assembly pilin Flp
MKMEEINLGKVKGFLKNEKTAKTISYSLIGSVIIVFVINILYKANWTIGDDVEFLGNTAIGK